ncbi:WD repeat-containing protein DDB_G0290555 [Ananas comosus]|uniref:WD repeat-containing protein DDB_G0290555 n=1 Tax=Ananas comosus TaxID=4615 RepID=A0A6P5FK78_ANACO|nr:WD repeat-containing protein DDB_G0290555 [Ananas comosus]
MPRTSAVESPGCPPLRVLTADALGLVKVVEARGKAGTPKVVETWGPPDASRCVVAASFADRKKKPILAVARKNGLIDFLNPLTGDAVATIKFGESGSADCAAEGDPIVGLHLFKSRKPESTAMLGVSLICTEKGKACLRSVAKRDAQPDLDTDSQSTWSVCNAGQVLCSSVDGSENYALFGGKRVELNLWDLANCSKLWTAKSPPSNSLGIFTPTCFTAATFLSKDDHRKIVAGTNSHQIRLYDISAQRRPVISVDFRESPIKAVAEDLDGHIVYAGTGSGDLASFDIRTGKLLGCFVGKCSGSIRSIARHPELPVIASCGLDAYLRLWDAKTRQPLSAVFLKQHVTSVVIDSHFSAEESEVVEGPQPVTKQDKREVDKPELCKQRSKKKKRRVDADTNRKKIKVRDAATDALADDDDDDDDDDDGHISF